MSRTYRRRRGDQTFKESRHWRWDEPKLSALFHADGYRFWRTRSTPSDWTRQYMTRPQRAEVRRLTTQVLRLVDLEEAPLFPQAKKPHIYYW